jgi:hypothetical protein
MNLCPSRPNLNGAPSIANALYMHGAGRAACLAVFRCDASGVNESGVDLPARPTALQSDADAVAATIVGYATGMGIDLIVLGNPSSDDCLADPAVNSVAHRVARTAPCSVLTVAALNTLSQPDAWSAARHT